MVLLGMRWWCKINAEPQEEHDRSKRHKENLQLREGREGRAPEQLQRLELEHIPRAAAACAQEAGTQCEICGV